MAQSKTYCECPEKSQSGFNPFALFASYDPVTEEPFRNHEPGQCKCTNELKQYRRGDAILTLCSMCHTSKDKPI